MRTTGTPGSSSNSGLHPGWASAHGAPQRHERKCAQAAQSPNPAPRAAHRVIPEGYLRRPTAGNSWWIVQQARHPAVAAAAGSTSLLACRNLKPVSDVRRHRLPANRQHPPRWHLALLDGLGIEFRLARRPVRRHADAWTTPAEGAAGPGHRSHSPYGLAPGPQQPMWQAQTGSSSGSPHSHAETHSRSGAGSPASFDPRGSLHAVDPPTEAPTGDRIEGQGAASSSALLC